MIFKKIILALLGVAFALAITSCNDHQKKSSVSQKPTEKEAKTHSRKW